MEKASTQTTSSFRELVSASDAFVLIERVYLMAEFAGLL